MIAIFEFEKTDTTQHMVVYDIPWLQQKRNKKSIYLQKERYKKRACTKKKYINLKQIIKWKN